MAIALGAVATAQMNTAEVRGVVQYMSGGVIVHAAVSAVSSETGVKFAAASDDSGHFQVGGLPHW